MPSPALTRLAPAKLNLFLHITGRRADGYHELQTLFQLLDYGDELSFDPLPNGELGLHAEGPTANAMPLDGNLILQAAELLRQEAKDPMLGAAISLYKRLPAGAGLGGGSSDAAATLLALNELWQLDYTEAQLCELGVKLGADVPVFLRGRSAWAEGVGEILTPVELPEAFFLVLTPPCFVATKEVFSQENLTRNSPAIKMADFLAGRSRNDCEAVTRALYPEVAEALDWLAQFTESRMTGTGASVFARCASRSEAEQLLSKLPEPLTGFVAQGVNTLRG
jgi:4-diphosphocytidyl-2-C-methyl-D-erythritol kinase